MQESNSYILRLPERARVLGRADRGEMEIITDCGAELDGQAIGLLVEDDFHTVVRDAVKAPSGDMKAMMRVIGRTSVDGPDGVTVIASLGGRIQLRQSFRHGTRRWELEAARGRREIGHTSEDTAREELEQELGLRALRLEHIGRVSPDTSLLAAEVDVFWAEVERRPGGDDPEAGEAFGAMESLEPAELWDRVRRGDIRDGNTLSALLLCVAAGKLQR